VDLCVQRQVGTVTCTSTLKSLLVKCLLKTNQGILGRRGTLQVIRLLLEQREARFHEIIKLCQLRQRTGADRLRELREVKILDLQTRTSKDGKAYNVYVLAPFGEKIAKRLGSDLITELIRIGDG